MSSTRRDFLQRSATAAAAITLRPLASDATAAAAVVGIPSGEREVDQPAAIRAFEAKLMRARPLALNRVRVLGGPVKRAQELDGQYLLALEPDRMLAYYRIRAELPQKAEPYGGWDGAGRQLTGHIAGDRGRTAAPDRSDR
jgi:hypothetical protein